MAKLGVEVDEQLLRQFRLAVIRQGKTVSDVIREFLAWYVAKENK